MFYVILWYNGELICASDIRRVKEYEMILKLTQTTAENRTHDEQRKLDPD